MTNLQIQSNVALASACLLAGLLASAGLARGQVTPGNAPSAGPAGPPVVITLDEAIHRAQSSDANYAAAVAASKSSALDRNIAVGNLLPSAVYHNQALYTQPNGLSNQAGQGVASQPAPRFIANNAVREYASQASINETVGLESVAALHHAQALAAQSATEQEIARRGLVSAVVSLFYNSLAADRKSAIAGRAHQDAADFTKLTKEREQARESAHADVIKAQLEEQARNRDFEDAQVAAEKAHLELGVLLFSDPRTPCTLSAPEAPQPLASREEINAAAASNNPEMRSALEVVRAANADVLSARASYLPEVGLNFTYGIDAPQFAVNGPDGVHNLGYSAMVTIDIPVWDWLNTERHVKQSEITRSAAQVALSTKQRQLVARLDEAYTEATTALEALVSLDESVATAAESLRLTKLAYSGGEATVLEVVDAQNAYIATQNAREDGRVRYEAARADLQTFTGKM